LGLRSIKKTLSGMLEGRELPFEFETDMVYFVAHPNNDSFVVGRFIGEKFKPYTPSNWNESFTYGQYLHYYEIKELTKEGFSYNIVLTK
jgi:hypothetical protein